MVKSWCSLYTVPKCRRLAPHDLSGLCAENPNINCNLKRCVPLTMTGRAVDCGAPGAPTRPRPVGAVGPARSAVVPLRAGCHPRQRSLILEVRFPPAPLRALFSCSFVCPRSCPRAETARPRKNGLPRIDGTSPTEGRRRRRRAPPARAP